MGRAARHKAEQRHLRLLDKLPSDVDDTAERLRIKDELEWNKAHPVKMRAYRVKAIHDAVSADGPYWKVHFEALVTTFGSNDHLGINVKKGPGVVCPYTVGQVIELDVGGVRLTDEAPVGD